MALSDHTSDLLSFRPQVSITQRLCQQHTRAATQRVKFS